MHAWLRPESQLCTRNRSDASRAQAENSSSGGLFGEKHIGQPSPPQPHMFADSKAISKLGPAPHISQPKPPQPHDSELASKLGPPPHIGQPSPPQPHMSVFGEPPSAAKSLAKRAGLTAEVRQIAFAPVGCGTRLKPLTE